MRIDFTNKAYIENEAYVHDSYFTGFTYDYEKRQIKMECESFMCKSRFIFQFNNVYGFNMNSCDWWGECNHIFDWEVVREDKTSLTHKLKNFWPEDESNFSRLTEPEKAVESKFTLASGDTLIISCESIDFTEVENKE